LAETTGGFVTVIGVARADLLALLGVVKAAALLFLLMLLMIFVSADMDSSVAGITIDSPFKAGAEDGMSILPDKMLSVNHDIGRDGIRRPLAILWALCISAFRS